MGQNYKRVIEGDIIERLLVVPELSASAFRREVGDIVREAAALIEQARDRQRQEDERWIDWERHEIVIADERRYLEKQEFALLARFVKSPGRLVTREQLIAALWGDDPNGGPDKPSGAMKVYLCRLRKKCPWPIRTVGCQGWVFEGYCVPKPEAPKYRPIVVSGITLRQMMAGR